MPTLEVHTINKPVKRPQAALFSRIWQYQKERFPLVVYGPLIASFTFAGLTVSAALRGVVQLPELSIFSACLLIVLCLFLQLRFIDDIKDYDEDTKVRPYLPVARGLLTKNEVYLGVLFCAIIQMPLACCLPVSAQLFLLCSWVYMVAIAGEFGAGVWLKKHPFLYLLSHMLIMPLIDLFITACDWARTTGSPPPYLWIFLLLSYVNGLNLELARKIRSTGEEEPLYQTYSSLLGRRSALCLWLIVIFAVAILLFLLGYLAKLGFLACFLAISLGIAGCFCVLILKDCSRCSATFLRVASGLITCCLYWGAAFSVLSGGGRGL